MTTAALLLAAGSGSRFAGREHKLLALLDGRPLYQHALAHVLDAGLDDVIIVIGAVELEVPAAVTVVTNPRWRDGQATSLATGLDAAEARGHDAVVVGLADQPGIPPETWRLVAVPGDRPISVATYGGVRANPVRLDRSVWELLPTEGDEGARSFIREHPNLVTEVPCPGLPGDIDTLEDLAKWNS